VSSDFIRLHASLEICGSVRRIAGCLWSSSLSSSTWQSTSSQLFHERLPTIEDGCRYCHRPRPCAVMSCPQTSVRSSLHHQTCSLPLHPAHLNPDVATAIWESNGRAAGQVGIIDRFCDGSLHHDLLADSPILTISGFTKRSAKQVAGRERHWVHAAVLLEGEDLIELASGLRLASAIDCWLGVVGTKISHEVFLPFHRRYR